MFHKIFSTGLGIGYIGKGAGTVAAMVCCVAWYLLQINGQQNIPAIAASMLITLMGVWSSNVVEKEWGEDPQRVVIDEIGGNVHKPFVFTG